MFWEKLIRLYTRLNLFFLPPSCVLCGNVTQRLQNLCLPCEKDLPILPQHCPQCANFLPFSFDQKCGSCLQENPPFENTYALFPYTSPIEQMITRLKFYGGLKYAKTFAELLVKRIQREWYLGKSLPDVIIPMPLHGKRLSERGFNQAVEIAKPLGRKLGIRIDKHGVVRVKNTLPQSELSAKERQGNVKNAFTVVGNYENLSVALIDDVMTTGQTVRELSKKLKAAGAKNVDVWCCARR